MWYAAVVYQIYLTSNIQNCDEWVNDDISIKVSDLRKAIIDGLKKECSQFHEVTSTALEDMFNKNELHAYMCPPNTQNSVIYDAHFQEIKQVNTTILVSCLNQWINVTNSIIVDGVDYTINKQCTGVLDHATLSKCSFQQLNIESWLAIVFGGTTGLLLLIMCVAIVRHR